MKRKVTIKDIAKELDVSVSTVSKAINNSSEISEETKQRVKALVELHDYRPNSIALSLKNKKSKTIAIVIPEIAHDFFSMVVKGIESVTNEKGYDLVTTSGLDMTTSIFSAINAKAIAIRWSE